MVIGRRFPSHSWCCQHFIQEQPETPSLQLVKSQVDGLEVRAQEQGAYGAAESPIPQPQTQSVSNSVGQEGVREKPVSRTAPGGKRNPSATVGVSYCAELL